MQVMEQQQSQQQTQIKISKPPMKPINLFSPVAPSLLHECQFRFLVKKVKGRRTISESNSKVA